MHHNARDVSCLRYTGHMDGASSRQVGDLRSLTADAERTASDLKAQVAALAGAVERGESTPDVREAMKPFSELMEALEGQRAALEALLSQISRGDDTP